jgi:hypothetical protein
MKLKTVAAIAVLAAAAGSAWADSPLPTVAGQTGTPEVERGTVVNSTTPLFAKRLGIISYCGDLSPNATDAGIFGRTEFAEGIGRVQGGIDAGGTTDLTPLAGRYNPILDASPIGFFGAQNLVDMINYDDGIPRFREVHLIDGDREQPTAAQLANNFDCVIAIADNKCTPGPQANAVYTQAANALANFANTAGKGVVLAGSAFNRNTGFGDALFVNGMSPFRRVSNQLDVRCSPDHPCPVGTCPAGATRQFPSTVSAPECFTCPDFDPNDPNQTQACANTGTANALPLCVNQVTGAECGQFVNPIFTPQTTTTDRVCESLAQGVNGPTSMSLANQFPANALSQGATACMNYQNGAPLSAVNARRNVIGLNLYPTYSADLAKTWFSCIVANAAILACGEQRCVSDGAEGTICQ